MVQYLIHKLAIKYIFQLYVHLKILSIFKKGIHVLKSVANLFKLWLN